MNFIGNVEPSKIYSMPNLPHTPKWHQISSVLPMIWRPPIRLNDGMTSKQNWMTFHSRQGDFLPWGAGLGFPHLMRLAPRNQRSTCNTSCQSRTPLSLDTASNSEASRIAARSSTRAEKNEGMLFIWFLCCCSYPIWQANTQTALDQANLLSGVRNDIEYISSSSNPFNFHSFCFISAYKSTAADSLLAERGRIDSSHRMTDDILQ